MTNNPLECRYWTQGYSVDDHVTFGEKQCIIYKEISPIWYMTYM